MKAGHSWSSKSGKTQLGCGIDVGLGLTVDFCKTLQASVALFHVDSWFLVKNEPMMLFFP